MNTAWNRIGDNDKQTGSADISNQQFTIEDSNQNSLKKRKGKKMLIVSCIFIVFVYLSLPRLNHEALRWSMWMRGVVIVCAEMSQRGDTDVFFSSCGPALTRHVPEFNSTDISLPIISHPLVFIFDFIIWFIAIKISLKYKCQ